VGTGTGTGTDTDTESADATSTALSVKYCEDAYQMVGVASIFRL
jgi:hypothetical protein